MHTVRPRRLGVRGPATVLLATTTAFALVACGGDDPEAGSDPTASSPTATSSSPEPSETTSATTSDEPTESPSASPTETDAPRPAKVRIGVKAGVATGAPERLPVAVGQTVQIVIKSDVADELHVHGVEQTLALPASEKQTLEFVVPPETVPGLYEVELHTSGLLLFQLEVR